MSPVEFAYWLQGYFEIAGPGVSLGESQCALIKRHLALVFKHEIDAPDPTGDLQATHDGGASGAGIVYRC